MECPVCKSKDYYFGDISGHNCANKNCAHFKGGKADKEEYADDKVYSTYSLSDLEEVTPVILNRQLKISYESNDE